MFGTGREKLHVEEKENKVLISQLFEVTFDMNGNGLQVATQSIFIDGKVIRPATITCKICSGICICWMVFN